MSKIIQLQGIQGSGKSTWAKELVQKDHSFKRINRDDLRGMIDIGYWNGNKTEKFIIQAEQMLAEMYIKAGYNIVVDDTGLSDSQLTLWRDFAAKHHCTLEIKRFDTPLEECIERDRVRPHSVGEKVIRETWEKHFAPKVEKYIPDLNLPAAVIFDVDGTLAHMKNRSPYDPTKYHEDECDTEVAIVANLLYEEGIKIIICSGRDDTYRDITAQWLHDKNIPYDALYMRPMAKEPDPNKKRKDWVVKQEIFNDYIKRNYQVWWVMDDRDQVVSMWRSMGLKVWQVAKGDF